MDEDYLYTPDVYHNAWENLHHRNEHVLSTLALARGVADKLVSLCRGTGSNRNSNSIHPGVFNPFSTDNALQGQTQQTGSNKAIQCAHEALLLAIVLDKRAKRVCESMLQISHTYGYDEEKDGALPPKYPRARQGCAETLPENAAESLSRKEVTGTDSDDDDDDDDDDGSDVQLATSADAAEGITDVLEEAMPEMFCIYNLTAIFDEINMRLLSIVEEILLILDFAEAFIGRVPAENEDTSKSSAFRAASMQIQQLSRASKTASTQFIHELWPEQDVDFKNKRRIALGTSHFWDIDVADVTAASSKDNCDDDNDEEEGEETSGEKDLPCATLPANDRVSERETQAGCKRRMQQFRELTDHTHSSAVVLGRGEFGPVTMVGLKLTGSENSLQYVGQGGEPRARTARCAVKTYHFPDTNGLRIFRREVNIISRMHHPNITRFFGALCIDDDATGHIFEEPMLCSLHDLLSQCQLEQKSWELPSFAYSLPRVPSGDAHADDPAVFRRGATERSRFMRAFDWAPASIRKVMLDVARGMAYLHDAFPTTLHGNFTSRNVLFDHSGNTCKVGRFYLCKVTSLAAADESSADALMKRWAASSDEYTPNDGGEQAWEVEGEVYHVQSEAMNAQAKLFTRSPTLQDDTLRHYSDLYAFGAIILEMHMPTASIAQLEQVKKVILAQTRHRDSTHHAEQDGIEAEESFFLTWHWPPYAPASQALGVSGKDETAIYDSESESIDGDQPLAQGLEEKLSAIPRPVLYLLATLFGEDVAFVPTFDLLQVWFEDDDFWGRKYSSLKDTRHPSESENSARNDGNGDNDDDDDNEDDAGEQDAQGKMKFQKKGDDPVAKVRMTAAIPCYPASLRKSSETECLKCIRRLSDTGNGPDIMRDSMRCVKVLGRLDANKVILEENNAVDAVLQHLCDGAVADALTAEWGCIALTNLALRDSMKEAIIEKGGCDVLLQLLENFRDHAAVQQRAIWVVANVALTENARALFGQKGYMSILEALKTHPTDLGVQIQGWWALGNVLNGSRLRVNDFIAKGGIKCAIAACERFLTNPLVFLELMQTLGIMCMLAEKAKTELSDDNFMKLVIAGLSIHRTRPGVVRDILDLISDMLERMQNSQIKFACHEHGLPSILNVMLHHEQNVDVLRSALATLCVFSNRGFPLSSATTAVFDEFKATGVFEVVTHVMEAHRRSRAGVMQCLVFFWGTMSSLVSDEVREHVASLGLFETVVTVVESYCMLNGFHHNLLRMSCGTVGTLLPSSFHAATPEFLRRAMMVALCADDRNRLISPHNTGAVHAALSSLAQDAVKHFA